MSSSGSTSLPSRSKGTNCNRTLSMPPKLPVVTNTGPLIALAAAWDDREVLAHVAMRVVVPGEVFTELAAGAHRDATTDKVYAAICCDIRPVFSVLPPSLVGILDIGEAA